MDLPEIARYFENRMKEGITLFTGAGFSIAAQDRDGKPLPLAHQLAEEIWPIAFPGEPFDPASRLGDIFQAARQKAKKNLATFLQRRLSITPSTLPSWYELYEMMPWASVYTLNIDNLWEAMEIQFNSQRRIEVVSAKSRTQGNSNGNSDLSVFHLNGTLADIPDQVTFSSEDYGLRLNLDDPMYDRLRSEFATQLFVFIGSELDEPSLWKYIQIRDPKGDSYGTKELRPRSFIVMPKISRARREVLKQYNVEHVACSAEEFAKAVLAGLREPARQVREAFARRHDFGAGGRIPTLSGLLADAGKDIPESRKFLLGREPYWQDIVHGRAIHRHHEDKWHQQVLDSLRGSSAPVVLLTGTAGDGKTTSAMHVAARLSAEGHEVGWISGQDGINYRDISRLILNSQPLEVLFVDNADLIDTELVSALLERIGEKKLRVGIIVVRSGNASNYLSHVCAAETCQIAEVSTEPLNDGDIDALLSLLERENMLGELRRLNLRERAASLQEKAQRQLIVGLLEATQGRDFHAILRSEYVDLDVPSRHVYCLAAVATTILISLTDREVISALSEQNPNETLNAIQTLVNRGLLARRDGGLVVRHRTVGQSVRDDLKEERHLSFYYYLLARMCGIALLSAGHRDERRRLRRLLGHTLRHDIILEFMTREDAGQYYEKLEQILSTQPHYWVQRASVEAEVGDLDLAKGQIENAFALAPNDTLIITTQAYIEIKRAIKTPADAGLRSRGEEGFQTLMSLVDDAKERDVHPFHIIGRQGLLWSKRLAFSTESARKQWLNTIRAYLEKGSQKYPGSTELRQLHFDVRKELLTGTT